MRVNSPYENPEFLRSRIVIPYDYETHFETMRQDQSQAAYMFARAKEREDAVRFFRAILGSIGFTLVCFAIGFTLASL